MSRQSIPRPESVQPTAPEMAAASNAAEKISPVPASLKGDGNSAGEKGLSEFAQVLARFRLEAGGKIPDELSPDLALEVVLNHIVEQACLATGATGAAIALWRGNDMVCRATSGGNAPGLGMRMDTSVGLSGACVRSGRVEYCDDAWNDSRTDAELLRQMEVRSVLVYPVLREREMLGILEIFSLLPSAFGDRDLQMLDVLAKRIAKNVEAREKWVEASVAAAVPAAAVPAAEVLDSKKEAGAPPKIEKKITPEKTGPVIEQAAIFQSTFTEDGVLRKTWDALAEGVENVSRVPVKRFDWFAAITSVIIFLIALMMIGVLGLRMGWLNLGARHENPGEVAAPPIPQTEVDKPANENKVAPSAAPTVSDGKPDVKQDVKQDAKQPDAVKPQVAVGSLQVFESGKEIFRMTPAGGAPDMPEVAQRVEPHYPEQALSQRIQGPVALDVHVGRDGTVQQVKVLSGNPILADAAVAAVRQWRFKPYLVKGSAVETESEITLKFTLPSNP